MRTATALQHYGTKSSIARALGITKSSVSKWGELVPPDQAKALEVLTDGALPVDWRLYGPVRRALAHIRAARRRRTH